MVYLRDSEASASRWSDKGHLQVPVTVGAETAFIDEALAPLIEAMWHLGIRTRCSCQASMRKLNLYPEPRLVAMVMFTDPCFLRRFLDLFLGTTLDPTVWPNPWRFELYSGMVSSHERRPSTISLHAVVLFPVEYLDQITSVVASACDAVSCSE